MILNLVRSRDVCMLYDSIDKLRYNYQNDF